MDDHAFSEQVKNEIREKMGVLSENPPKRLICDIVTHEDGMVELNCGGYEFAVFVKSGDAVSDEMVEFMEREGLSHVVIDADSSDGQYLEEMLGFVPMDLPMIYSTMSGRMVHRRTCPKKVEDLYVG